MFLNYVNVLRRANNLQNVSIPVHCLASVN